MTEARRTGGPSRRIAFWGTPEVAVPGLQALVSAPDLEVAAVVTNPDRPRGRSREPVPPPVKTAAVEHGIEVLQPERPRDVLDRIRELDLAASAIVAYGAILPEDVLQASGAGFVNLHFSLLPRWRGAAPVQHAIRAGDDVTGITTFLLDAGMDTGPILAQEEVRIGREETAGSLLTRLAAIGAPLLVESVRMLLDGRIPTPQPDEGSTVAGKIHRSDVEIEWDLPAANISNLVRSANPAPGAYTTFRGDTFKIWRAHPVDGDGEPGTVVSADGDGLVVGTGRQVLCLDEVQPAGKARMEAAAFVNGYQPEPGERLGK